VVLQDNSSRPLPTGSATITFAAGSATATLIIDPTADPTAETDETIGVQIAAGDAYRVGTANAVVGTILNDDPSGPLFNTSLPTVTLVASPAAVLEDGPAQLVYTFTRTGSTASDLVVTFAAARDGSSSPSVSTTGGDFENHVSQFTGSFRSGASATTGSVSFTGGTGSVTIRAGETTATLTLDPRPDTTVEADESIYLTLTTNQTSPAYNLGTIGRVNATILNDDFAAGVDLTKPNITLSLPNSSVYEDGAANLVYSFSRTGSTAEALTVNLNVTGTATLPGQDFTVTGASHLTTAGSGNANLAAFQTYAGLFADSLRTGAADPLAGAGAGAPANANANAATRVWLYETWARPDMVTGAKLDISDETTGAITVTDTTAPEFYLSLEDMTADLKAAYDGLAAANPAFAGVAPVGEAFLAAVQAGVALRDPFAAPFGEQMNLWWDDSLHASKYGSYLAALTLFGRITRLDPRALGAGDEVAADLDITGAEASALQKIAALTLGASAGLTFNGPSGTVFELGTPVGTLATEGGITFGSADTAGTHSVSVTPLGSGHRGTLTATIQADTTGDGSGGQVNWRYEAQASALESLAARETTVETFTILLSDSGGGTATRQVSITLLGSNDAPVITSAAGVTLAENSLADAYQATATDVDATDTLTWSLSGADAALFALNLLTGAVRFLAAPDFESPGDADGDGDDTYLVDHARDVVRELPGGGTDTVIVSGLSAYRLGSDVEHLVVDGASLFRGVGNELDNVLTAGAGNATLFGQDGNDTLWGGVGNDTLNGAADDDSLEGGDGNDRLAGGDGNDALLGGLGNDTLLGGNGHDWLEGGVGHDLLSGGAGNDTLLAGPGNDTLTGGADADMFRFAGLTGGNTRITDFVHGLDVLEVSATGFAGLDVGGLEAEQFSRNGAVGTEAQFVYFSATGALDWAANGTAGPLVQLAQLGRNLALDANDFIVIA
jgi:VCBS repeat-containing protein